MGFGDARFKPRLQDKHFQFDLNDAQYQEKWPKIEKHHLIIMAEVIEHLYISPVLVFKCISTLLKNGGYLFLQTPNACSLGKRIKMLIGKNPYEMIRNSGTNPGHFREYTIRELVLIGKETGFTPVEHNICNYFVREKNINKVYNTLISIFPSRFRAGITMCFKKV